MKTVAGIDLGTQSMKVVIYDYEKKEIIEKASCPMELISKADGTREQKAEWFDNGLDVCFGKLSAANKKTIEAIGVSGQQHGFVPLGKNGKALYKVAQKRSLTATGRTGYEHTPAKGAKKPVCTACNLARNTDVYRCYRRHLAAGKIAANARSNTALYRYTRTAQRPACQAYRSA